MKNIISLCVFCFFVSPLFAEESETTPKTVKFIISPETTYIDGPTYSDGSIDYISAANQRLAKQTTKENNVLYALASLIVDEITSPILQRAVETDWKNDPKAVKAEEARDNYYKRYCKMLGFETMPDIKSLAWIYPDAFLNDKHQKKDFKAELLQVYTPEKLEELVAEKKKKDDNQAYPFIVGSQYTDAIRRLWKKEEFLYLALWLDQRKELVEKLIDISKTRTGYYHPLASHNENELLMVNFLLPQAQTIRAVGRLFVIQGNLDFTNGDFDHAFESAFSSIRIGKTMRHGSGTLVENLVGISMIGLGNNQLTTFLADFDNKKDAAWILQKKKEFDAAALREEPIQDPPTWCILERFCILSSIQQIAADTNIREKAFLEFSQLENDELKKYKEIFGPDKDYDWNEMMRQINRFFDDMEDVFTPPSPIRQRKAVERIDKRLERFTKKNETDDAAQFFLTIMAPAVLPCYTAFERILWGSRVTSIAFSLAAYRADHDGKNPDTLDELVPKYIESIPIAPSTGKPMRYVKRQHDVLIPNDDFYKLDGSETDVEKIIAETKSGSRAFPAAAHYIFVVQKE